MKYKKELKGFLIAPMVTAAVFALVATSTGLLYGFGLGTYSLKYAFAGLIWFLYALPVAYIATFIIGIPGYILYVKSGLRSLKAYLLGGLVLGFIAPFLLLILFELKVIFEMGVWLFLPSTVFGLITSYTFWRIVVRSDSQAKHQDTLGVPKSG